MCVCICVCEGKPECMCFTEPLSSKFEFIQYSCVCVCHVTFLLVANFVSVCVHVRLLAEYQHANQRDYISTLH